MGQSELAPEEAARRDRLQELISELDWFLKAYRDTESPTTWVVDEAGDGVEIKPLNPARYLQHTVWDRGNRFALLSATMLSKESFCRGVGLDPSAVALVDIPHTFPLENRPLVNVTRGKMTYKHRDETLPRIARLLVQLMSRHPQEKGLIHAHSYGIADTLVDLLCEFGVGSRIRRHGRADRDAELAAWLNASDPEVFVSVKMEEALDLHGDRCRWQVLCKAPYLDTSDSRVARRLEESRWGWYHRAALRTVIQACGRVVRAPTDSGTTYLADKSLLELFDRAATDMPPWFADQVAAITTPSLPDFDPDAALTGVGSTDQAHSSGRGATNNQFGSSPSSTEANQTRSETDAQRRDDHPLSDVWGDE
ncbi:MAG: Helicase C-terminal domain protein [uncultured archaeon A07HR60]|nr:MAG: Helicase C-terminal domain protein [uncultured archaeon A07HR60]